MPRLHGYREKIDTTVYDAFSPRELVTKAKVPYVNLFGNRNIGTTALTNMQIAGGFGSEETFVILTWYARTNLTDVCRFQAGAPYRGDAFPPMDLIRAWDAWANVSTATLSVGTRPMQTRPLSELFGPRQFGNCCGNPSPASDDVRRLAEKMWTRHRNTAPEESRDRRAFTDLRDSEQEVWIAAAGVYPFRLPIIVPVRQNFGVSIHTDPKALDVLLKVMPENVAPRPLVWVHLDGVVTRSIA